MALALQKHGTLAGAQIDKIIAELGWCPTPFSMARAANCVPVRAPSHASTLSGKANGRGGVRRRPRCVFGHMHAARSPAKSPTREKREPMSMVARAGQAFRAAWPLGGVGLAVALNGVWIGALGYGISKFF